MRSYLSTVLRTGLLIIMPILYHILFMIQYLLRTEWVAPT
nr:MAG TPA: hypothetical protein [Caudoviricetes sp.]